MEKFEKGSIARDMIRQRQELEKQPPTLDEIAEEAAKALSVKMQTKDYKACSRTRENFDPMLREIIQKCADSYPEKNQDFLDHIPDMHLSWKAMERISTRESYAKIYSLVMVKVYKGQIPFEIEKIILALDNPMLIKELSKANLKWSDRAQTLMSKFHPNTYKQLFTENHDTMVIFTI